eukprot:TRINITY_DN25571_c0_g1_i2.p1 TRINITY_DN25571_c0_g1~~TRINITY_DN25571_c0_g1_i2.p1  ORF type:complete len:214 (+),score=35.04 TRINITY_DN25571_c0_g1_i2:45-686(+)
MDVVRTPSCAAGTALLPRPLQVTFGAQQSYASALPAAAPAPRRAVASTALGLPTMLRVLAGVAGAASLRPSAWPRARNRVAACRATASADGTSDDSAKRSDPMVMTIVLRQDLDWPTGALINQACHASVAVAWDARNDEEAQLYFNEAEGQMVKATMAAKNEEQLLKVAKKLGDLDVPFKLWVEQPENVPVCIATWPRRRSAMKKAFNGLKRF